MPPPPGRRAAAPTHPIMRLCQQPIGPLSDTHGTGTHARARRLAVAASDRVRPARRGEVLLALSGMFASVSLRRRRPGAK